MYYTVKFSSVPLFVLIAKFWLSNSHLSVLELLVGAEKEFLRIVFLENFVNFVKHKYLNALLFMYNISQY